MTVTSGGTRSLHTVSYCLGEVTERNVDVSTVSSPALAGAIAAENRFY
ncbi:MAG: hypothetical protein PHX88_02010 [Methanoculleus horonobensis]|nr:hypothetical protein [Methanoculleus horonobensis]